MNEELVNQVAAEVFRRLQGSLPRALCIGTVPEHASFLPVSEAPWDMVVLCSLSPGELLAMPTDAVCRALLEGTPVYLMEEGLEYKKYGRGKAGTLYAMLMAKERELRTLGIKPWKEAGAHKLLTAKDVEHLRLCDLPKSARLTPLARDLLEGKT